jgi:acylglycerol lipase
MEKEEPFSFEEIKKTGKIVALPAPQFISATDHTELAYYHEDVSNPVASLIFVHGGGAYSGAGYQYLAKGLAEKYRVSVYLTDIRGHGNSGGKRGDTPSVTQVYRDLSSMSDFVKKENPDRPIFLGGHSSGGGLVLNYISRIHDKNLAGYVLVSPRLGERANVGRQGNKNPFATVNVPVFAMYSITKGRLFGNTPAVKFNYPEVVLKSQPLLIRTITCHMSAAITPFDPEIQFRNLDKPFALFVGGNDELFNPEKVLAYAGFSSPEIKNNSITEIIPGENHLSILKVSDDLIGRAIMKFIGHT